MTTINPKIDKAYFAINLSNYNAPIVSCYIKTMTSCAYRVVVDTNYGDTDYTEFKFNEYIYFTDYEEAIIWRHDRFFDGVAHYRIDINNTLDQYHSLNETKEAFMELLFSPRYDSSNDCMREAYRRTFETLFLEDSAIDK